MFHFSVIASCDIHPGPVCKVASFYIYLRFSLPMKIAMKQSIQSIIA